MAHLFKQMYLEDITDIEKQFTPGELTTAITIELIKRKIDELQRESKESIIILLITVTESTCKSTANYLMLFC